MNYVCHSGGALGSDIEWEIQGEQHGIKTIAYSFKGHNHKSKNPIVLTAEQLNEGYEAVIKANESLKRNIKYISYYVRCLISRDWFQVKNSESVFAIAKFVNDNSVTGGTGWAVQMGIDNKKPVFVFDQPNNCWKTFNGKFEKIDYTPKLTENFAGVGTRELLDNGKAAIKAVYETNLSPLRIVAITPGFEPGEGGSIPSAGANL
jgi:hypothetical protein